MDKVTRVQPQKRKFFTTFNLLFIVGTGTILAILVPFWIVNAVAGYPVGLSIGIWVLFWTVIWFGFYIIHRSIVEMKNNQRNNQKSI